MNKEIKEKWVKALTSGEYKQGQDSLRSGQKFCCLGVLCDLASKEGIGEWRLIEGYAFSMGEENRYGVLPKGVLEWAELGENPSPSVDGRSLAGMNDCGTSFEVIADLINTHL